MWKTDQCLHLLEKIAFFFKGLHEPDVPCTFLCHSLALQVLTNLSFLFTSSFPIYDSFSNLDIFFAFLHCLTLLFL